MSRPNMSLPHERRKAKLKSAELNLRVRIAESKNRLNEVRSELSAMRPTKPKSDI